MKNYYMNIIYPDNVYECILLTDSEGGEVKFNDGCPVIDHAAYVKHCIDNQLIVNEMSSLTHFLMDVDGYKTVMEDGIEVLTFDWM